MQRTYKEENSEGIFIGYKEGEYLKKLEIKTYKIDGLTPALLEQSPYKLHVSLHQDEYINLRDKVKEIIINHLLKGTIYDFKLTNSTKLLEKFNFVQSLLNMALQYKSFLDAGKRYKPSFSFFAIEDEKCESAVKQEQDDEIPESFIAEFRKNIKAYYNERTLPNKYELEEMIKHLQTAIINLHRLLDRDQFTIYIPENYDKEGILNLCKDIDFFLTEHGTRPGTIGDVQSPIGRYLTFRQDYLLDDFDQMNRKGIVLEWKRIDSIKERDDESENKRRRAVVAEQEESDLYKYLKRNLSPTISAQNSLLFQSEDKEKKEKPQSNSDIDKRPGL